MSALSKLPNIGPEVERQLLDAGISSPEELRHMGAEQAWLKIQAMDPSACIHRLLALEGAVCNVKKTLLPEMRKQELKEFYRAHKIK